ncbi:MAG: hypothetical protein HC817_05485 [Saprospiraceae bacterium]|nr:hypothetical protein [Saprospiraceae bacterium]
MWAVEQLYNGLVYLDDSLRIIPCLAKSWSISADGLTYRFVLNNNVHFHDNLCFTNGKGRLMTSSDVVYSFNRIIDSTINSPGSWIFKNRVCTKNPFEADPTIQLFCCI